MDRINFYHGIVMRLIVVISLIRIINYNLNPLLLYAYFIT